jgi:hypothetical protein
MSVCRLTSAVVAERWYIYSIKRQIYSRRIASKDSIEYSTCAVVAVEAEAFELRHGAAAQHAPQGDLAVHLRACRF